MFVYNLKPIINEALNSAIIGTDTKGKVKIKIKIKISEKLRRAGMWHMTINPVFKRLRQKDGYPSSAWTTQQAPAGGK